MRDGLERSKFRAHPAFTLREMGKHDPSVIRSERLGFGWLRLDTCERQRREEVFFAELLRRVGRMPHARIVVTFMTLDDAEVFAARCGSDRDGYRVSGESTGETAAALAHVAVEAARIDTAQGEELLVVDHAWRGVAVWLCAAQEQELRHCLERVIAGRASAHPDAADHPVRALTYIATANATWVVSAAVAAGTMWLLNGNGLALPLAIAIGCVVLVVLVLAGARLVDRHLLRRLA